VGRSRIPRSVEDCFWALRVQGVEVVKAAEAAGVSQVTARRWVRQRGGVKPRPQRTGQDLTLEDRIAIQAGIAAGDNNAEIARRLGVHRSSVGRELARNRRPSDVGPANQRRGYSALKAQERADCQRRREKPRKLDENPVLHGYVQRKLKSHWSPEQISNRLRKIHGKDPEMSISHEAIYQAIYVRGAGGLKRELKAKLRTGRTVRKPQRSAQSRTSRIPGMVSIVDRPEEALGRAVPGYWEGDLITGELNKTAVGTLVDRCSRYVMLLHLPERHGADEVHDEMLKAIHRMPARIRKSVTWDQGSEMARHLDITATTGVQVYFCNPHSPWERPTNENTNGLLREFLPKGGNLSRFTREDLDEIEDLLNNRPRKALDWLTPIEYLTKVLEEDITVAMTA
jgi:IS30 family transposase